MLMNLYPPRLDICGLNQFCLFLVAGSKEQVRDILRPKVESLDQEEEGWSARNYFCNCQKPERHQNRKEKKY